MHWKSDTALLVLLDTFTAAIWRGLLLLVALGPLLAGDYRRWLLRRHFSCVVFMVAFVKAFST